MKVMQHNVYISARRRTKECASLLRDGDAKRGKSPSIATQRRQWEAPTRGTGPGEEGEKSHAEQVTSAAAPMRGLPSCMD